MKSRWLLAGALLPSLLVMACAHRSSRPAAAPRPHDAPVEQRPPPGTRVDSWPDLGAWSTTGKELPGSSDPFLWEKPAALPIPAAQVPLRMHRPID